MKAIDLSGKTALVTGATRGIGLAIAHELSSAGANLILTGTREEGESILDQEFPNLANDQTVEYYAADFGNLESLHAFIELLKSGKHVDICVNNAGTNHIKLIHEISIEDVQHLHQINLHAPFLILSAVVETMKKQQWGRIVNIGSLWSVLSRKGRSLYATSKQGLMGLTMTTALEYAPYNVLVNMVSPGFVMTDLSKATLSAEDLEVIEKKIPVGKFANPKDIANTVLYLCCEMNSYVTGQNIIVDGGYSCE